MKIQNLSVGENLRLVGWWRSNSFLLQTLRLTILYSMIERNIWKYFSLSSYRLRQVPQDLRNFL